ncbi:HYR domain-containing protein [Salegentibacter mishustinae]|uniref:LamG-like jellyroll fold domain-containing protein n=1 Tax=Salegentibacter mishustinae TaxID=270918 RepID=UPI001CE20AB1|nr:LamG-like jellyroll fold domain-containing protein [Salegentibacter mishustinae]UBZ05536.1 HYR domain-containing protein [Salegentibacter mishustinae]
MGKITPRIFLAVFILGLYLLSANTVLANIKYGPEKPISEKQIQDKSFFVGFLLEEELTITAPSDINGVNKPGECFALKSNINLGNATFSGSSNSPTNDAPTEFPVGSTTVTWTVTDDSGNTATDTQLVNITDSENPQISLGNNISENTDTGNCTASIAIPNATFSDNCSWESLSWIMSGATSGSGNGQVGTYTFNIGTTTIDYTVTDAAGNNISDQIDVTIADDENPEISLGNNISENSDTGNCTASIAIPNATFSDNCSGESLSWTMSGATSGSGNGQVGTYTFNIGITTIDYTVTDAAGNNISDEIDVVIEDNEKPTISAPADVTVDTDNNECTASSVSLGTPTTGDNCEIKNITNDAPSVFSIGETTVIWTVTDSADNTASITQKVTVEDKQAPFQPTIPTLEWTCEDEIINFPTTTDNCNGEITGTTSDPLSYDTYGTYTITWKFTDDSENSVTATQEIIIPEPTVEIPAINNSAFCNAEEIPEINFSGANATSYQWSYQKNSSTDIGLASSGTGNIPAFTAKNNSSEPIIVDFTVIPFGGNCQGEPKNFQITINPTPTITKPENIVVCAGETIDKINFPGASVSGTSRVWINDNTSIGLSASGQGNIESFTATNSTTQSITATITLTPTANNCEGISETFTIEVKPNPELEIPEIPELCNGVPTEAIPINGNFNGITYDISGGASIGLSNKSDVAEIPVFTPVNNTESLLNATIKINPKANGCIGETVEVSLSVKPSPVVNTSYTNQICSEAQTDLLISSPVANTSYTWTVDAPTAITGAEDGNFEIADEKLIQQQLVNNSSTPQIVTYNITPEADGCTGTTIPVKITVNPIPEFVISLPNCPESIDLTDPTIKNNSSLNYTYWEDEDATIEINNPTELSLGTYYIKGQSDAGCALIKEVIVDKIKPVITNLNDSPTEICSGDAFDFLPESNLEETTISWSRAAVGENPATNSSDRNNINPNESLVNNTNNPITATYIFTLDKNGCTNEIPIEVEVAPAPQLIQEPINEICNGSSIDYTPISSLPNSTITWRRNAFEGNQASSGSGSINEILYNDTGLEIGVTYFITITSAKGCSVEESISFSLLSGPKVTATSSKNNICAGETVDLFSTFEGEQSVDPVLLDENFNGSTSNWQSINNSSGGNQENAAWKKRNGTHNMNYGSVRSDGSTFYITDSDAQGQNGNTRTILLFNKPLNTIGYSSLELSFWQDYRDWDNNDRGRVQVSTNKSDWTTVETINGSGHRDENTTVDLSGFIGQEELYIRFNYRANWGYWWAIDDVKITGEGSTIPDVTWTSSTNPDWTSNEPNPTNISVSRTTVFTATYTDPEIECPGVGTVEVVVKDPLQPEIIANYCSLDQTNQILLSVDGEYDSYRWVTSGQTISSEESLQVSLAQTYTLYVTKDGCEASTSITPNENLIANGDFENGNTGFNTVYGYVEDDPTSRREMYPEGLYAIGENAYNYHNNFSGLGHGGRGNFMIVNGDRSIGNIVWQSNTLEIIPDTDYYFSAWTSNVNPASPARLRIQVLVNNAVVVESNLGDLTNQPVGNWINFYNPELWNSGSNTEVVVRIINENPTAGGNDFGIDDISFSAFRSFDFEFTPENNGPVCEGETIELAANLDGGRLPITFDWSGPNGFSQSTTITEESERAAADTIQLPNSTAEMAGEYSLQITDFYGCNLESKTTTVEVIEKAVVFAGEDLEICSNNPNIDLSTASINHPTINSGFWSTINGDNSRFTDPNTINTTYNPNENEISSGEIALVLTSNQDTGAVCETVSDTINIIFNISPELELVSKNVSCFEGNDGKIEVNILENTGTGPFTYVWSDGQTGRIAQNLQAGDYYVDVTDAKSCVVTSDTISILQPEELLVENPIQLEEASCFDEYGTVVAIPVQGGLFADETIDAENIPYVLDILDSAGNEISLEQEQIIYDINTGRFIVSGLQGGKGYTFLISSSENCAAEVKTFTTLTPPEINAGEVPEISECGIQSVWLAASPIDPEIGSGSWSYNNGETALLGDPGNPNTTFTGQSGQTYTLTWSVASAANPSCNVSTEIEVTFPPTCSKLNFDGDDDYVNAGNNYTMAGSDFSIEAWVKPNNISGVNTIISKRVEEEPNLGYDLILNNGSPSFRVRNRTVTSSKKITTNRWYHIAGVYSDSKMSLFVDGIEIQTNTNNIPGGSGNFDAPFLIGATYSPSTNKETKDHFNGFIEEVRLWNTAISSEQIRFFMNQRLEKEDSNVSGTVLGNNLNLPNAPEKISWSNLLGYYQLLAQNNLISDGFTDNLGSVGESAHGLLKNIQEMQENTAPLPYILYTSGQEWFNKPTWKLPNQINGQNISQRDVWNPPGSQGIDNSRITWNIVKLSEDIKNPATQNNQNNINLLALISENGILNMEGENNMGGSQTGFGTGNALTITHYLELNGYIDLNGESQLIQTEGSEISGSGGVERDQQGTASSYNYNYWSSPVLPNSNSQNYKVNQVLRDGSTVGTREFQNINFKWAHTHADGPKANPIKISDFWINAFRARKANEYSQWEQIGSYTALKPGEGYTMKGTSGEASINDKQNYTFSGFPNNGTIEVSEIKPGQNYLLGNPYPSAISVEEFILDNIKDGAGRNNKNLLNGAVYFWDHFGGHTHYLAQYVGGYAVRNLIDGVSAISNDSRINASGARSTKKAGPYIPVGQGFFVNTTPDASSSDTDDFRTGKIVFKNSQRSFVIERGQSSSFFLKPLNTSKTNKNFEEKRADNRYKIRLEFHSPTGYHREVLVGADSRTSQSFDLGFDAPLIDKGPEDMYWMINDSRYVIQGVPNFNLDQKLPIGLIIADEKEFSIEIGELENVPDIIDIYLRDNSDSTYHDLRKEAFKTSLPAGEYQDLYEIVFHDVTSTRKDKEPGEGPIDYYYSLDNREFVINNPELHKIEHINIYNIAGQLVDQHFGIPDLKEIRVPQKKSLSSAVYIVKVYTDSGDYAKKVIIRKD